MLKKQQLYLIIKEGYLAFRSEQTERMCPGEIIRPAREGSAAGNT